MQFPCLIAVACFDLHHYSLEKENSHCYHISFEVNFLLYCVSFFFKYLGKVVIGISIFVILALEL